MTFHPQDNFAIPCEFAVINFKEMRVEELLFIKYKVDEILKEMLDKEEIKKQGLLKLHANLREVFYTDPLKPYYKPQKVKKNNKEEQN